MPVYNWITAGIIQLLLKEQKKSFESEAGYTGMQNTMGQKKLIFFFFPHDGRIVSYNVGKLWNEEMVSVRRVMECWNGEALVVSARQLQPH